MMKRTLLLLLIVFAVLAGACSSEDSPDASPEGDPAPTGEESPDDPAGVDDPAPETGDPEEEEAVDNSEYIFDQEQLHTYELNLSEEDLAFLDEAPNREEYVEGTLAFEGETIPVGIRYKGSIGAFLRCVDGNDVDISESFDNPAALMNTSGAKTCTKLSIKVKTNWEDSKDEFYGQRRLQFHSMNNDDSQMKERLGYTLYGEFGVAAPRATHARVVINGVYSGVYVLVEQIDGRFTRRNFEDGTGNLVKEVWPIRSDGSGESREAFLAGLKTNEDDDPSLDLMVAFGQEVAAAKTEDQKKAVVEKRMDVDALLRQMVVDRTIRHDDGPTHWRCPGGGPFCMTHNFYWYMDPTAEKAHLIPWDLDAAFNAILFDVPIITIHDEWGEITDDCAPVNYVPLFGQRSAACDKLFGAWALFEDEYDALLAEFMEGPFAEENIEAKLTAWEAQITDATVEAAEMYDDAISVAEWQSNLEFMRRATTTAREKYAAAQ